MPVEHLATWVLAATLALKTLLFPLADIETAKIQPPGRLEAAAPGVRFYETSVTLPTYPFEQYQTPAYDPEYNWRYQQFDYDRFRTDAPAPAPRTYRAIVLENEYLKITLLPELGGRIWRVVQKQTGDDVFYHNSVVKPTPWGPTDMQGWTNVGGLEWGLPVVEHGYAWGVPWDATITQADGKTVTVALALPDDGQDVTAAVRVTLRAGETGFEIAPSVTNLTDRPVTFAFWHNAALAPGRANHPSAATHFILPTQEVTIHSTADPALPLPGQAMTWPDFAGRALNILGNWHEYLGFFERPAAHGPFVALYDAAQDAGVARIFPADTVRGSKVFGLGWSQPLDSDLYTDDGSAYVELHGGLAPTFFDEAELAPRASVSWREYWLPLARIGGVRAADAVGALNWTQQGDKVRIWFQPARGFVGELVIVDNALEIARVKLVATPAAPWTKTVTVGDSTGPLQLRIEDKTGSVVLVSR